MLPLKNILVATDFSETSERAMAVGEELARALGARLTLVHVFDVPPYTGGYEMMPLVDAWGPIRDAAQKSLDELLAKLRKRWPESGAVLREGATAKEILAVAQEIHADLVLLGTHGRRGVAHVLLGSVAERVVRTSPVPVLTVGEGPQIAVAKTRSGPPRSAVSVI